jgi:MFS family permease
MTGSALALGWVSTARSLALFAFSLLGGTMADRMSKRNLLIAGRAMVGANLLVLAILISGGAIRLWHLVASSLVSGMTFSLVLPAREALIPELVDR